MTQTKITFSYEEICDFSQPTVITMEVPERSIDMMCEYFQRFLSAAGYIFDEGERIKSVRDKTDGSPFVYDFGDGNNMNCYGVRGGMAEDIIKFD